MSKHLYILNKAKKVVQAKDLASWVTWSNKHQNRRVANTERGDIRVSTVFLTISLPVYNIIKQEWEERYFETMVFSNGNSGYRVLSKTWEEAKKKHKETVKEYIGTIKSKNTKRKKQKV